MAQHKKITLKRVEELLDKMEDSNWHNERILLADFLRLTVALDAFVVKHDRTDLARRLRRAFDDIEEKVWG